MANEQAKAQSENPKRKQRNCNLEGQSETKNLA